MKVVFFLEVLVWLTNLIGLSAVCALIWMLLVNIDRLMQGQETVHSVSLEMALWSFAGGIVLRLAGGTFLTSE